MDVGTVTDASTLTEPEILGPCEPGTAVNLEGIVWHETDTGTTNINKHYRLKPIIEEIFVNLILSKLKSKNSRKSWFVIFLLHFFSDKG